MFNLFTPADIFSLVLFLALVPGVGIIVSLKKNNSDSYFLAGRSLKWYVVAGSIFGTNINSSHLIGMLGIGYSIGFAQSHYEFLAVPAILLLCFVFIPIYRKNKFFTLSQFLESRYDHWVLLVYTILMVMLILVQLVAGLYIGSRTLMLFFRGTDFAVSYWQGVIFIALITCSYALWGGLNSIVTTDGVQSVLMLLAGLIIAVFTFIQPEIGGLTGLLELEKQQAPELQKMRLYLPSNHPDLPWTGVFTGLIVLQCFYWTTNQYLVQRTLAANSDREAQLGSLAAGFLKLLIPLFTITVGVAAGYIFQARIPQNQVVPDDVFMHLVELVVPAGYGLMGMILAGVATATFSSVDSMLNSASTLLTIDIYKRYVRPKAGEKELLKVGRLVVLGLVFLAALLAFLTYHPASRDNFFLKVSSQGAYLTPGIVAAFFIGISWKRAHPLAAVITMLSAPLVSIALEQVYAQMLSSYPAISTVLGAKLNFLHRVFFAFLICLALLFLLSLVFSQKKTENKTGTGLSFYQVAAWVGTFLLIQFIWIALLQFAGFWKGAIACLSALSTFLLFVWAMHREGQSAYFLQNWIFYAGLLSALTIWLLYIF